MAYDYQKLPNLIRYAGRSIPQALALAVRADEPPAPHSIRAIAAGLFFWLAVLLGTSKITIDLYHAYRCTAFLGRWVCH